MCVACILSSLTLEQRQPESVSHSLSKSTWSMGSLSGGWASKWPEAKSSRSQPYWSWMRCSQRLLHLGTWRDRDNLFRLRNIVWVVEVFFICKSAIIKNPPSAPAARVLKIWSPTQRYSECSKMGPLGGNWTMRVLMSLLVWSIYGFLTGNWEVVEPQGSMGREKQAIEGTNLKGAFSPWLRALRLYFLASGDE